MIAGLRPSTSSPWVIKGAMDGPAFVAYIRDVLIPEIEHGTAMILDNLATHRNKKAERPPEQVLFYSGRRQPGLDPD